MNSRLAVIPLALVLGACADGRSPAAPTPLAPSLAASRAGTDAGDAGEPIPGRYIVRFTDDVQNVDAEAGRLVGKHAGKLRHTYRSALRGMALELSDAEVAALRAEPTVAYVEQDQVMAANTIQSGATWGIDRVDQRALPLGGSYVYGADGTGVTVYIVDTGILYSHGEFGGRAVTGVDEITAGGTATDCNGHGTHVSGTVGGATYGVAKKVRLVGVRVLDCSGSGSNSAVIAGIDWVTADHQAGQPAAANMSLGGGFSQALNDAVARATADGVVFAVAAGNGDPFFGIPQDACKSSPSSEPSAITVGATTSSDAQASFSNYGTCVDINAPGVGITSSWYTSPTATNTISGTSMATPHVAGAAALYLQANPSATVAQVTSALVSNATVGAITGTKTGTPNRLLYTGFISAGPPVATAPVARFTSSCASLACSFDASATAALPGASYAWTFGDGSSGSGVTASHSYGAAGPYTVTLTVTDANGTGGATGSVSPTVPPPTPAPVPSFTKSCSRLTCTFNASATTDATSYAWTFGDGGTANGVSVSHGFARNASYTVTLTATGAGGSAAKTTTVSCTSKNCS